MADASDTQHRSVVPIAEDTRVATGSVQYLLEAAADGQTPVYHANHLELYICGEEAFAQIARDIRRARGSIDIICWGFDPAMELTRSGTTWPRGDTWGGLLEEVASGKHNAGQPVQVRVLSWYGFIGNLGTHNMPGHGKAAGHALRSAGKLLPPAPTDPRDRREVFNARWYRQAFDGELAHIAIRTRDGDSRAVKASLQSEPGKRGPSEALFLEQVPTHHQKTILIDYDHEGGAGAVGYVMGLNSVTDYWDTSAHLFHDPRRGAAWEGASDSRPGLKPLQDYACRIRGAALVAVSRNFTDAWNRAKGSGQGGGAALQRTHDLHRPPAGLSRQLGPARQRAQIVRTQPEEGDKSIQRLYRQASSFARHYLFVENQYFQHAEWARQLKQARAAYAAGWQAAGRNPGTLPNLHVMVVIPTPELVVMVPRTHDAAAALGQGGSMPHQDKRIDEEVQAYEREMARYEERQAMSDRQPHRFPPPARPTLGALAAAHRAATDQGQVKAALEGMGLRTLIGSLWSYDGEWRSRQNKELERLREWEDSSTRDEKGEVVGPMARQVKDLRDWVMAGRYREIYIHSKLMLLDDSFFTLGSANLNLRSMAVDSEINVASDDVGKSTELRRRVWALHTGGTQDGGDGSPVKIADTFEKWEKLMQANKQAKDAGNALTGFLVPFEDKRISNIRLG